MVSAVWQARRELFEGCAPTFERLAAAFRCDAGRLRLRARKEGWEDGQAGGVAGRLAALRGRALDMLERLSIWDEPLEGAPARAGVNELSTLLRTLEKLEEDTRDGESAKDNQTRRDAEIAGILARLEEKILEHATALAEGIVADELQRRGIVADVS